MATNVVEVRGLKKLLAGLQALPADLSKNAAFQGLNAAARLVRDEARRLRDEAKARAPSRKRVARNRKPGTLRAAIRVSRSRNSKPAQGWHEVIVRVKRLKAHQVAKFKKATGLKSADNPDDPYYWWWVEFGTQKMAARPFLRPGFESTKSQQLEALRKRLRARIQAYAAKVKAGVDSARG
jgi:HK97 gp10 family phage protein